MKKTQLTAMLICTVICALASTNLNPLANRDQDRFKHRVYDCQVELWTARGATYVESVPGKALKYLPANDSLPGRRVRLHRDIFDTVRKMLKDARQALALAQSKSDKNAQKVTGIRVRSGYRAARVQLYIWERHYPKYYRNTRKCRQTQPGGEHGEAAARFLATYINKRVFSPGYSPHQKGKTIDLTYKEKGAWAEADASPNGIRKWQNSWLFAWLQKNAHNYGFALNPDIDEPWHWEHEET